MVFGKGMTEFGSWNVGGFGKHLQAGPTFLIPGYRAESVGNQAGDRVRLAVLLKKEQDLNH